MEHVIRVLWMIKGLGAGGAERLLTLSAQRHSSDIRPSAGYLLPHKQALAPDLESTGVATICLGSRNPLDPRWIARLRRLLAREEFDVVHVHSPVVAIGTRIALRTLPPSRRPRLVTTEHNVWDSHTRSTRFVDGITARGDETHLAVSAAVRDSMPSRLRPTTRVVLYGVDTAAVRSAAGAREGVRKEHGWGDDEVVVGTIANLRATKGYPDLLEAAAEVVRCRPQVRFAALGQGPLEHDLKALHSRLGLREHFAWLGYRADALEVMSAFDIFCLASHHEGLPIALMEALGMGLPVVATTAGGIPEIVTHEREALLVPPRAPHLFAQALLTLVDDAPQRAAMARRARERGDVLDVAHAVREVEEVYRSVTAR